MCITDAPASDLTRKTIQRDGCGIPRDPVGDIGRRRERTGVAVRSPGLVGGDKGLTDGNCTFGLAESGQRTFAAFTAAQRDEEGHTAEGSRLIHRSASWGLLNSSDGLIDRCVWPSNAPVQLQASPIRALASASAIRRSLDSCNDR